MGAAEASGILHGVLDRWQFGEVLLRARECCVLLVWMGKFWCRVREHTVTWWKQCIEGYCQVLLVVLGLGHHKKSLFDTFQCVFLTAWLKRSTIPFLTSHSFPTSDGSGSKIGSGQPFMVWVRIWKISPKMSSFSIFFSSDQKNCFGSESTRAKAGSASYLLRVKGKLGSGRVKAHLYFQLYWTVYVKQNLH